MKVATASEMRVIDRQAVEKYGIPSIVLMENAGVAVYKCVRRILTDVKQKRICIFAGKGNNGGDAFVAARHLSNNGAKVKVFVFGDISTMSGDAKTNFNIIKNMVIDVLAVSHQRDWDRVKLSATFADCLIDGLVGTGFQGELSPDLATAVEIINSAGKMIVAVDIPSGVEADTGQTGKLCIQAGYTVTFGLPKPGLLLYPGAVCAGEMIVADIGIPAGLLQSAGIRQNYVTVNDIKNSLPRRKPNAHKGDCGRVMIVAGSPGLTGAAALASMGALRSGAGLVTLGIAGALHDLMEVKLTEVMTRPLPDIAGTIDTSAVEPVVEFAKKCDALAIGPGLGSQQHTQHAVREIIQCVECPLVIDADGLNSLAGHVEILNQLPALAILTPHPGEMARLTGITIADIERDRITVARQAAQCWEQIVVLKGSPTIIAFPDGEIFLNTSGNCGMATGGTGDVLTGVIAGLIAQGMSSHDAAVAGVYLHGLAGDITGEDGLAGRIASDLLTAIPSAILGITG